MRVGQKVVIETTIWWSDADFESSDEFWAQCEKVREFTPADSSEILSTTFERTSDLIEAAAVEGRFEAYFTFDQDNS